jgi:hypothetical protein
LSTLLQREGLAVMLAGMEDGEGLLRGGFQAGREPQETGYEGTEK